MDCLGVRIEMESGLWLFLCKLFRTNRGCSLVISNGNMAIEIKDTRSCRNPRVFSTMSARGWLRKTPLDFDTLLPEDITLRERKYRNSNQSRFVVGS